VVRARNNKTRKYSPRSVSVLFCPCAIATIIHIIIQHTSSANHHYYDYAGVPCRIVAPYRPRSLFTAPPLISIVFLILFLPRRTADDETEPLVQTRRVTHTPPPSSSYPVGTHYVLPGYTIIIIWMWCRYLYNIIVMPILSKWKNHRTMTISFSVFPHATLVSPPVTNLVRRGI